MKTNKLFQFSLLIALGLASVGINSCKDDDETPTAVAVQSIALNKSTMALAIGSSETLQAIINPDNATDKTITWTSSDNTKATVDANGKVTAVANGTATITAQAGDKTATCVLTVSTNVIAVSSVSLNKTTLTLAIGEFETLTATVLPANATDKTVTWSSNNANATVDADGKVTAVAEGTAIITATAGSKMATCTIKVLDGVRINGIIWAKSNVDAVGTFAATPESPGMFYQWNRNVAWDVTGYTIGGWDVTIPTGTTWETVNDPSPDGWRIPTLAEQQTLLDNTKVTTAWDDTKKGYTFTDKTTGTSIFLLAVGLRYDTDGFLYGAGSDGFYWSSTQSDGSSADHLEFRSSSAGWRDTPRGYGFSVRCVAE